MLKRRDAIKLGSAVLGGLSLGMLAGCKENYKKPEAFNTNTPSDDEKIASIVPKQTGQYNFSCPMPFDKHLIDELYNLNKSLKRCKITTFYSSIPSPLADEIHPFLSSVRGHNTSIQKIDDYIELLQYSEKKGFKNIYALNLTRQIMPEEKSGIYAKISGLFNKLTKAGLTDVKICNPSLIELIHKNYPDMNIHISTNTEFHSAQNYEYVYKTFPFIKSINIATDDNHNFHFLQSLKTLLPKVNLELLVNEHGCVKYCISRFYHQCTNAIAFPCKTFISNNPYLQLARNNLIHPWELAYYSAIGINNFKLTCLPYSRMMISDINFAKDYIGCADRGLDGYSANDLLGKIHYGMNDITRIKFPDDYKLEELARELPDMNYYVKNGHKCSYDCDVNCKYCYNIAENLRKIARGNINKTGA